MDRVGEPALILEGVSKRFGRIKALDRVDLTLSAGLFGLLGPNGAGKTTLLRVVATFFPPDEGDVRIFGHDVRKHKQQIRSLLGYLPQDFQAYRGFTGWEYLEYLALLKELPPKRIRPRVEEVLQLVGLEESAGRRIAGYSGGMLRRLGIAQALLNDPKVLLLDEPTGGLDPEERVKFRTLLVKMSHSQRLLLLSTHLLEDIANCCRNLAVLDQGCLCYSGSVEELLKRLKGRVFEGEIDSPLEEWLNQQPGLRVIRATDSGRGGTYLRFLLMEGDRMPPDTQEVSPTLEDAYLLLLEEHRRSSGTESL